jgi:hypothetical protein
MTSTHRRFAFAVAFVLLACGQPLSHAQSMPPTAYERAPASPAIAHPYTEDPDEIESALLATDPAEAARLFSRFTCAYSGNGEARLMWSVGRGICVIRVVRPVRLGVSWYAL